MTVLLTARYFRV